MISLGKVRFTHVALHWELELCDILIGNDVGM